jgi:hypothetical protein
VDVRHCGRCGNACASTQRCAAGACAAVCAPGICPGDRCAPLIDRTPDCYGGGPLNGVFFADVPCVPCDAHADCPPPNFRAAFQCIYTNTQGNVGSRCLEYEFACGFVS